MMMKLQEMIFSLHRRYKALRRERVDGLINVEEPDRETKSSGCQEEKKGFLKNSPQSLKKCGATGSV